MGTALRDAGQLVRVVAWGTGSSYQNRLQSASASPTMDRLRRLHPPVAVDGQVDLVADRRAHGLDALHARAPGGLGAGAHVVAAAQFVKGGQLDRRKALVHGLPRGAGKALRGAVA